MFISEPIPDYKEHRLRLCNCETKSAEQFRIGQPECLSIFHRRRINLYVILRSILSVKGGVETVWVFPIGGTTMPCDRPVKFVEMQCTVKAMNAALRGLGGKVEIKIVGFRTEYSAQSSYKTID